MQIYGNFEGFPWFFRPLSYHDPCNFTLRLPRGGISWHCQRARAFAQHCSNSSRGDPKQSGVLASCNLNTHVRKYPGKVIFLPTQKWVWLKFKQAVFIHPGFSCTIYPFLVIEGLEPVRDSWQPSPNCFENFDSWQMQDTRHIRAPESLEGLKMLKSLSHPYPREV